MTLRTISALAAGCLVSFSYAATVIDLQTADPSVQQNIKSLITKPTTSINARQSNTNKFITLSKKTDLKTQMTHTRYQQYYKNIPVYGHQIIVHQNNQVASLAASTSDNDDVTGEFINDIEKDINDQTLTPAFDAKTALFYMINQFKKSTQFNQWKIKNEKSELIIYIDDKQTAHLAYLVNFVALGDEQHRPQRPYFIMDANSQLIITEWDGLTHAELVEAKGLGGNEKMGQTIYGETQPKLTISYENNVCKLQTPSVTTIDQEQSYDETRNAPYQYPCEGPDYFNAQLPFKGSYSTQNDAHYFGSIIEALYQKWFNVQPLTTPLVMKVNYGSDYGNAFFDGESMYFGDGDDMFYPLVSLDIAAHEISHGFTEQHSSLEYRNQSGAMNESFSDMASKAAEYFAYGKTNWGIGGDVVKPGRGYSCDDGTQDVLRCMDNPESDGLSIRKAKDYDKLVKMILNEFGITSTIYDPLNDPDVQNAIVHTASGVYNHVFYLLATKPNWDIKKAFSVMVYANENYWTPYTNYTSGATGVLKATKALKYDVSDVIAVFKSVDITCNSRLICALSKN